MANQAHGREQLHHKEKKESTAKWFIFFIIPILNLYWLWKVAESVSGHDDVIREGYESLGHIAPKDSTAKWFVIFLIPALIGVIGGFSMAGALVASGSTFVGFSVGVAMSIAAFAVGIYILYKMAGIVSGHETYYPEQYESLKHLERKESTAKWFVFGIIPILNIYFAWKMSEVVSGHEEIVSKGEESGETKGQTTGTASYCPECGAEVDEDVKFCPECGADLVEESAEQVNKCPECGAEVDEDVKFCPNCGAEL